MPARFVLQPNGRLARFSSVIDNFTHYDMTREEAIEVAREDMGREAAIAKVERGLTDEDEWCTDIRGDGTGRWRSALQSIEMVHGKAERDRVEAEMSKPVS